MTRKTSIVAAPLFCSGLSALIDQTVWLCDLDSLETEPASLSREHG